MWRYYAIKTEVWGAEEFLAPDLETAFVLARAKWPAAVAYECVGSRCA